MTPPLIDHPEISDAGSDRVKFVQVLHNGVMLKYKTPMSILSNKTHFSIVTLFGLNF